MFGSPRAVAEMWVHGERGGLLLSVNSFAPDGRMRNMGQHTTPCPAPSRGSAGLAGVSKRPARLPHVPVRRHQLPQGSSTYLLTACAGRFISARGRSHHVGGR